MKTKKFPLRVLLTVTTGRLLTESKGEQDNSIGDLYNLLCHMTNDTPFTHQLGWFGEECKPWPFKWFPELGLASACLPKLDGWLNADRTNGREAVKMWLTEIKMLCPTLKDEYEVPQIPKDEHQAKDPVAELIELRESKENIVIVHGQIQ